MAGFSVPKMPVKSDLGSTLETAVANKIGKSVSNPSGWTMGKKTGWNGAAMPPGQLKKTTPGATVPKPNMNDQGLATRPTKVRRKPLEGA